MIFAHLRRNYDTHSWHIFASDVHKVSNSANESLVIGITKEDHAPKIFRGFFKLLDIIGSGIFIGSEKNQSWILFFKNKLNMLFLEFKKCWDPIGVNPVGEGFHIRVSSVGMVVDSTVGSAEHQVFGCSNIIFFSTFTRSMSEENFLVDGGETEMGMSVVFG